MPGLKMDWNWLASMIKAQIIWRNGRVSRAVAVPDNVYHRASGLAANKISGKSLIQEIIGVDVKSEPKCVILQGTLECGYNILSLKLDSNYPVPS